MNETLKSIYQDLASGKLSREQALVKIKAVKSGVGLLLAVPHWQNAPPANAQAQLFDNATVVLCGFDPAKGQVDAMQLANSLGSGSCEQLKHSTQTNAADRFGDYALALLKRVKALLGAKPRGNALLQLVVPDGVDALLFTGLAALLKTASAENPHFCGQLLQVECQISPAALAQILMQNRSGRLDSLVRYQNGVRQTLVWQQQASAQNGGERCFKEAGVYLITGGLGGLGALFAKDILQQSATTQVILTGRRPIESVQAELAAIGSNRAHYYSLDISDSQAVKALVDEIVTRHGQLNGVLHCAGVSHDNLILTKSAEQFAQVLAPKVMGSIALDQATSTLSLDFMVLFSSIASALGNLGQADYATANGFMDGFAHYRNQQVAQGARQGLTVSINWPFWHGGGMALDRQTLDQVKHNTGLEPIDEATGLAALHQCLAQMGSQVMVLNGDTAQLRQTLSQTQTRVFKSEPVQGQEQTPASTLAPSIEPVQVKVQAMSVADLRLATENYLKQRFSGLLKMPAAQIDAQAALEQYGIDSILSMSLTTELEKTFGSLPKTLFFEYQTLAELAQYFVETYADQLTAEFGSSASEGTTEQPAIAADISAKTSRRPKGGRFANKPTMSTSSAVANAIEGSSYKKSQLNSAPIAIIGLSGRYPQSPDIQSYWQNLAAGKDCITEVPSERWDWRQHYSEDRTEAGKHYSKWGGFIAGVDQFDPRFFNISPKEAQSIDPQERLFLQYAWMAMEDAGYTRATLQQPHDTGMLGEVGVYAGVMYGEYKLSGSLASVANRVSWVLNLHGPCLTVETMCSSSLTSVHLACQDLRLGRTNMALAGGVNVTINQNKYLMLSAEQFISSDGNCQSFGDGGDGYIPGEGVGVVVLKRLSDAEHDGDHIYGLITGSALNHGGKTNGYSVPNPQAQASVIHQALIDSDTDPRHISYIEAHGTGTKLGDPIEIAGLNKAFYQDISDKGQHKSFGYCAIGSAKSNIGHCEAAAGIAGITKVLLQLKHQQLVPSLHSEKLNPHIDFEHSPFVVNQNLKPWPRPVIDGVEVPRIAGVSSFGAGGANAHIVFKEYVAKTNSPYSQLAIASEVLVVLSARTPQQLEQKCRDLNAFIRQHPDLDLAALAYTLQVGREAMKQRAAVIVNSLAQLQSELQNWLNGQTSAWQQGQVKGSALLGDEQQQADIAAKALGAIKSHWVAGVSIDWTLLYGDVRPNRISLPVYPFAEERYWLDSVNVVQSLNGPATTAVIHPLLMRNRSDMKGLRFDTELQGFEPEFSAGKWQVLAFIEMARAAVFEVAPEFASHSSLQLQQLTFAEPPVAEQPVALSVALFDAGRERIDFEIYHGTENTIYCQGQAIFVAKQTAPVAAGPAMALPAVAAQPNYYIQPQVLCHGVTQCVGLADVYAIERVSIYGPCGVDARVYQGTDGDIEFIDSQGTVCLSLSGVDCGLDDSVKSGNVVAASIERPSTGLSLSGFESSFGDKSSDKPNGVTLVKLTDLEALKAQPPLTKPTFNLAVIDVQTSTTIEAADQVQLHHEGDGVYRLQWSSANLEQGLIEQLISGLNQAQRQSKLKLLLLASSDVAFLRGDRAAYNRALAAKLYHTVNQFPYPLIAEIVGEVSGAGFVLAAMCDFMLCSQQAQCQLAPLSADSAIDDLLAARFGVERKLGQFIAPAQLSNRVASLCQSLADKTPGSLKLLKQHLGRHVIAAADRLKALSSIEVAVVEPAQLQIYAAFKCQPLPENRLQLTLLADCNADSLTTDLVSLLESLSGFSAVILTSEHHGFVPPLSAHQFDTLQSCLFDAPLPVIAALAHNAKDSAWLLALCCDEVVYHDEGRFSCIFDASGNAPVLLSQKLGRNIAADILLGGSELTGRALGHSAAQDKLIASACELANLSLAVKRSRVASLRTLLAQAPTWPEVNVSRDSLSPDKHSKEIESVAFKSQVVKAQLHPNGVLQVAMADRAAKNMFSDAYIDGINEVFAAINADVKSDNRYKVVVLTGFDNYFSCGGTKDNLLDIQQGKVKFTDVDLYRLPLSCPLPVVAAMQGHAIGAGWSLGMFCDFTLFSEQSTFVSPYMGYGFTPGAGATLSVTSKLGLDLGRETLMSGAEFTGIELKRRGLTQPVLPRADVLAEAMVLADKIARQDITRLIGIKAQLNGPMQAQLKQTLALEVAMHEQTFVGDEQTLARIQRLFVDVGGQKAAEASQQTPVSAGPVDAGPSVDAGPNVIDFLRTLLAEELRLEEDEVEDDAHFVDLGLDSITGVTWVRKINQHYGTDIEATKVYSYPTLALLSAHVISLSPALSAPAAIETVPAEPKSLAAKSPETLATISVAPVPAAAVPGVEAVLKTLLGEELHLEQDEIEEDAQFVDLGLDSITGVTWVRKINNYFGTDIEATKVYSYPTLSAMAEHVREQAEKAGTLDVKVEPPVVAPAPVAAAETSIIETVVTTAVSQSPVDTIKVDEAVDDRRRRPRPVLTSMRPPITAASASAALEAVSQKVSGQAEKRSADIAVIGMAGAFPNANNLEQYWDNIASGRDCIRTIANQRWSLASFYQAGAPQAGKTNCQFAGCMDEYDLFDPLFFSISPSEAQAMDPQHRVFLQASYHAVENAGYTPKQLSNRNCGVFVGCASGDYHQQSVSQQLSAQGFTGSAGSILSGRVAYFLDLTGPCLSIDTACSASLVAISSACDSLQGRVTDMALAGGVYVMSGPQMHIKSSATGMLSTDGKCYSFDQRANGFVPGEGVGVVVLKRLVDAQADQDNIVAVIKGWGVNQDGKTNGITAPNPIAQTRLQQQVYDRFAIDPGQISLIEAHGTGTKLGDPIEIEGLQNAFKPYTDKVGYCAVGSVKSNIGHCLTAAGISGFLKLVLALKHKQLPPTVNFNRLNEHIRLDDSPFYINEHLQDWTVEPGQVRQAAVSSFGFSGTNSHIVVAEYQPPETAKPQIETINENGALPILLCAKSALQLGQKVQDLMRFLSTATTDVDLTELAYTLQIAKEPMDERLAIMASDVGQLMQILQALDLENLDKSQLPETVYRGEVNRDKASIKSFKQDQKMRTTMFDQWLAQGAISKLAQLWVKGLEVDWTVLYPANKPRRVPLPLYPFAKQRYWIEETDGILATVAGGVPANLLHPLVHRNTSDLSGQRYHSEFSSSEPLFADHQMCALGCPPPGQKVLPPGMLLELTRAAVVDAAGDEQVNYRYVYGYGKPLSVLAQSCVLTTYVTPGHNNSIDFEVVAVDDSEADKEEVVVCHGQAIPEQSKVAETVDLDVLKAQMKNGVVTHQGFYHLCREAGLNYGPSAATVGEIYLGEAQLLAELFLDEKLLDKKLLASSGNNPTSAQYVLHPGIVDGALQAAIFLASNQFEQILYPESIAGLHLFAPCISKMFVHVSLSGDVVDIALLDDAGHLCAQLSGVTTQTLALAQTVAGLLATPVWLRLEGQSGQADCSQQVILCELDQIDGSRLGTDVCLLLESRGQTLAERYKEHALTCFEYIKNLKPKGRTLVQIVLPDTPEQVVMSGLSGLLKTCALENPLFTGQLVLVDSDISTYQLATLLKSEQRNSHEPILRYSGHMREVMRWHTIEQNIEQCSEKRSEQSPVFKDNGVYLITGGTGSLGLLFAREIVTVSVNAQVILTGRSALSEAKQEQLSALGESVHYCLMDLDSLDSCQAVIEHIVNTYGQLNGIIHSAGMARDNFVVKKSVDEFNQVLAPKVAGSVYLDSASKNINLDFMALFSSVAGCFGNLGQADYACANGFMDHFAYYRNQQVAQGLRRGHTVSFNWPLWAEGGMQIDPASQAVIEQNTGSRPMQTTTGINAFYQALSAGLSQVVVLEGNVAKLKQSLLAAPEPAVMVTNDAPLVETELQGEQLTRKSEKYISELLCGVLKMPAGQIDAKAPLEKYGIDSVMAMSLTAELEKTFGTLSKTLFFEYQTLAELSLYFVQSHGAQLRTLLEPGLVQQQSAVKPVAQRLDGITQQNITENKATQRRMLSSAGRRAASLWVDEGIAIIGLSGRYPQSPTLDAYWHNLREGIDCVTEVPKERWDWHQWYSEDRTVPGKHYSKWGGFIVGVDLFDPLFFNISPREAEAIDPQERIFLQHAWMAIEDAGYTRERLQIPDLHGQSGQVGVYVGVTYGEYNTSGSLASVANRVSYVMNLHGPSMQVDTMCSSSLTALHLACQDLRTGRTALAIAGGVNLSISPSKYQMLSTAQFISGDGHCQSFGDGGDGYIPGEGVGVVVLQPLSQAVQQGQSIYGVIRATALNHGGKTNGYSVPNPIAQGCVISRALRQANIDPRAVSYIEAHGTGTKLGDPIEITALSKAFGDTSQTGYCLIGSTKSNIGHCESAAGISGLTKVLLQMKHQQIVPSLHSAKLNPHINFDSTPFVVNQRLQHWQRPVVDGKEQPRIAGISSFGAGGANAHVIVAEYDGPVKAQPTGSQDQVIIVLSAMSVEQVQQQASNLLDHLLAAERNQQPLVLKDIAYTLQLGREAMVHRLGIITDSVANLAQQLTQLVNNNLNVAPNNDDIQYANVNEHKAAIELFKEDDDMIEALNRWVARNKLSKLLALWVKGLELDWSLFYTQGQRQFISLPSYPFAKESYWRDSQPLAVTAVTKAPSKSVASRDIENIIEQIDSDTIATDDAVRLLKDLV